MDKDRNELFHLTLPFSLSCHGEEFGCLEWHTDREWSVDQMMHFLNRTRERNLEDENIKED